MARRMIFYPIDRPVEISELHIYPVKALGGISLGTSRVQRTGLEYDRQWMVSKADGAFMSQREYPQMARVGTEMHNDQLFLSCCGMQGLAVPAIADDAPRLKTKIWGDHVHALAGTAGVDTWLSEAIGEPCRLVAFPGGEKRYCDPRVAHDDDCILFADGFPLLIISEASLQDLNNRLECPVAMDRFRPNIVIRGCNAFAEDSWKTIKINGVTIRCVAQCPRCLVPTVDPQRGIPAGPEPLATLSGYRKIDGKIMFGVNAVADMAGTISVGDTVNVLA